MYKSIGAVLLGGSLFIILYALSYIGGMASFFQDVAVMAVIMTLAAVVVFVVMVLWSAYVFVAKWFKSLRKSWIVKNC